MQNYKNVLLGIRESFLVTVSYTLNSADSSTKDSGSFHRDFVKFIKCQQKQIAFVFLFMLLLALPAILTAQYTSGNAEDGASTPIINSQLQLRLISFTSDISGRNIKLNWITASEQNISGFEVERTKVRDQKSEFIKVGFAEGIGTINTQSNYSFEDKNLQTGKYQYRLKQIDNEGNFEYHNLNGTIEVGLPTRFELSQNSPNPLNQTTKVDFALPQDSKVSIKIYDVDSKEVLTLVNGLRTAGFHSIQFYAPDLSSGTYFYSFIAESGIEKTVMKEQMLSIK